jgi:LPS sulfotransferase NodH
MSAIAVEGYLLCSIERTGSNLVTDALKTTGMAGHPAEYFNPSEQTKPWIRDILGGDSIDRGMPKILKAGTSDNGVFGAKLHWNHMNFLGMSVTNEWDWARQAAAYQFLKSRVPDVTFAEAAELLRFRFGSLGPASSACALLQSFLPDLQWVWLTRRNMVARAISHFRARQTGRWYQPMSDNRPPMEPPPEFDFSEIHALHCLGHFHHELWDRFFQQRNISPHCVVYEDLIADYEPTIRGILQFLDLADAIDAVPPPVSARQSDALSQEWECRYREIIGGP